MSYHFWQNQCFIVSEVLVGQFDRHLLDGNSLSQISDSHFWNSSAKTSDLALNRTEL